jgi:hypothetical protein
MVAPTPATVKLKALTTRDANPVITPAVVVNSILILAWATVLVANGVNSSARLFALSASCVMGVISAPIWAHLLQRGRLHQEKFNKTMLAIELDRSTELQAHRYVDEIRHPNTLVFLNQNS